MTPEIEGVLVGGALTLGTALIMRFLDIRARNTRWRREDRLRFMQNKRKAYAEFLGGCQTAVGKGKLNENKNADWLLLQNSLQMLLLIAPAKLVKPAQNLMAHAETVAELDYETRGEELGKWAAEFTDFCDQARTDLGMDVRGS